MSEIDERKILIERYENKYLITEALAAQIREHILFFCEPDPYADPVTGEYTVHSLYFDTPDLSFYRLNKLKVDSRIKPRVRIFDTKVNGAVFLEVKRRIKDTVWKVRQRMDSKLWPSILDIPRDDRPDRPELFEISEGNLDDFTNVITTFRAVPTAHVRYRREAYVSEIDDYVRITFDRQLSGKLAHGSPNLEMPDSEMESFDAAENCGFAESPVILEVKCQLDVPTWVLGLIKRFHLNKRGFSKYIQTIDSNSTDLEIVPSLIEAGLN